MADDNTPSYKMAHKMRNTSKLVVEGVDEPAKGFSRNVPKDQKISPDIIDNRNNASATDAGKAQFVEQPMKKY